ncbi:site-specific recombinase XerD [Paenibacillus taihuensis]|uniref:Site-specific recombinase XerD n=1 Tax=Paenibacillus taihuensis TaxID=1156355 RepID=A0A3D9RXB9_9BACL|nr:tyrosine-type recombinase/integrase [Paenibacillus taihuensis]REE81232.1 site-specific recombinase XerD [Paenibacillus taihuensis]
MTVLDIGKINLKSDRWDLQNSSSLGDVVTFFFDFIPNQWVKKTIKELTIDSIALGKPSLMTLIRYNTSLKHFFAFLKEYSIELNSFADLTNRHTEMFVFYLQQSGMANSTCSIAMSTLKWIIEYGQFFDYDGFPEREIFDGQEYSKLKTEDVLKTKHISDEIMIRIESALVNDKDTMLKCLIEIGIDTGIRLSEALELERGCIIEDFTGKPILHVVSKKNNTERFIPVSVRVKKAVNTLETLSEEARIGLGSNLITCYRMKITKGYNRMTQAYFRKKLKYFIKRNDLYDSDGGLYPLTYHALRHTLGTKMLNCGMTIFEVQEYLGHLSLHSTAGYAKVLSETVSQEYNKLGFVGKIVEGINQKTLGEDKRFDPETLKSAALPDGSCVKPISNEGKICAKYNMCIICPKFVTTPDHLQIHKDHLARILSDKEAYMAAEYIGTSNHLQVIETALKAVIEQLEVMVVGKH